MKQSSLSRRAALKAGLAGAALLAGGRYGFAQDPQAEPPAAPPAPAAVPGAAPNADGTVVENFDFESFSAMMRRRASQPFVETPIQLPDLLAKLSYDEHRAIRFIPDHALWRSDPANFQLQAFYPGAQARDLTRIFVGDGKRFQLQTFTGADFEYRAPLDPTKFQNLVLPGIAGFRLHYPLQRPDYFDELVTFLGASYFRALGMNTRYGLSARGLAINTATQTPEEFPRFSAFYIVKPGPGENDIRIFAELDSASLTGAYAFTISPGPQTVMEVTARLYFRNAVDRLGVAPLTSMFTFGENDRRLRDDFRPEVHDNDGLSIHRRNGERLWRPLRNPEALALSYFQEASPVAFGLLQRDRDFSHYEDTESRYEVRPSLMIEPIGDWGKGMIELVEIPTKAEINDNIVAFWVPEKRPEAGSQYEFRYRMRWGLAAEAPYILAQVQGTFGGPGGNPAEEKPSDTKLFAINFEGGTIASLPLDTKLDPIVDVPDSAELVHVALDRLPSGGWRMAIELRRKSDVPVELRAKLSMSQRIVSETWLYQWTGA
ncbi:glucans biosynthesis protein G [Aureimonas endophytica]|uniref:Glucans biosynthesis protein G n=1 Tax=Aureimonas endophytica TaxID=2027858 RepID=A0A917E9F8_9HYPH|nr:glucan biosynthesis protein G [Aureimonas endophytica]GGE17197.1 glucans biosynthesis protein G [Aureimonas endophytica]